MQSPKLYLIPGLGADGRMYGPMLKEYPGAVVLEHRLPLPGEDLSAYARRLAAEIDTSIPFALIGTSLGGMIAIEMANIVKPEITILISSVKHPGEMPFWLRSMKHLGLHRLLSGERFIRISNSNIRRLISKRDHSAARLIMEMHNSADRDFVYWGIDQVINWKGAATLPQALVHIHGKKDRLFPHQQIKDAVLVAGGSHVMVLTQAREVIKLVGQALKTKAAGSLP